jgi:hypothetical protein
LKVKARNITRNILTLHRIGGVILLMMMLSLGASAQNTKGDRPTNSRDGRFKIGQKSQRGKIAKTKRIKSKGRSLANSADYTPRRRSRSGERVGRPLKPVFSVKEPSDKQRAWKGDITGRRIRHRNESSKPTVVHPQRGRYVKRTPREREGRQNVQTGRPVKIPSATGKIKNVYPQRGPYVRNPSSRPRDTQKAVSNRSTLARLKTLETPVRPPGRKARVVPRTASRAFIRNKSINVYANFKRPKKKGERAVTTDLAGRKLRTKNFQSGRPAFVKAPNTYRGRRVSGERPYAGPSGHYKSVSGKNRGAWLGDITNRRVGGRSSKKSVEGTPSIFRGNRSATRTGRPGFGGGYRSATRTKGRVGSPIPVRAPGIGANGIGNFRGNKRHTRGFRNQGEEFTGVFRRGMRVFRNQGEEFTGVYRRGRRETGGGSVSGKRWNNNGSPIPGRTPGVRIPAYPGKMRLFQNRPGFGDQGEEFSGNIKSRRSAKGGGSRSGKLWNNSGSPIEGRQHSSRGYGFSGLVKSKRSEKGGGSVSGRLWNNKGLPVDGNQPGNQRGMDFAGNIKAKRPAKGGGSVSGRLWNNKETPLAARTPPESGKAIGGFPGKMRRAEVMRGFRDQGEEFTGSIRLSRLRRDYIQNKKAHDESILKKKPEKEVYAVEGLQVKVRRRDYVRNKDVAEDALRKKELTDTDKKVGGMQVRIERRAYVRNKNSSDDALMKLRPTKTDQQVSELQVKVRQYNYKRNPSSDEEALKVREPGKAFARVTDYQGNIRMQRFRFFDRNKELHPDARFVRTNKNNVKDERDSLTNLKIWWARLFKKQENQPDHLKEKGKKPRYDKGEQGMWYD